MNAKRAIGAALVTAGAVAAAYPLMLRKWCLNWGATPLEVSRAIPGDELNASPDTVSTRAITIDAPPSAIWPWLVQMGSGRGGAYTYDWIENLFGLNMHSADEILPEYQHPQVGDVLPVGPNGPGLRLEIMVPDEVLAFRSEDGNWVWQFALYPLRDRTRLVSRNRITTHTLDVPERLAYVLMEPGSLVMERKMLLGIKQRAERLARQLADAVEVPEPEPAVEAVQS
jgi:hypothetical protein